MEHRSHRDFFNAYADGEAMASDDPFTTSDEKPDDSKGQVGATDNFLRDLRDNISVLAQSA